MGKMVGVAVFMVVVVLLSMMMPGPAPFSVAGIVTAIVWGSVIVYGVYIWFWPKKKEEMETP